MVNRVDLPDGWAALIVLVPEDFCAGTAWIDVVMYNDQDEVFQGRMPHIQEQLFDIGRRLN
jgi:hypothetical protein